MITVVRRPVAGRLYRADEPDRVHADLRTDPAGTVRALRKTPAAWDAHYGCHRCQAILLALAPR
ncbi:hypothetical protein [Streptomonospora litoralis]|uniref:Uncharacterized protein n=1 Tax=Streptomonospora litoralis TaxID=2498135 RepID=A0A4P6PYR4_9ACTN|nr:hypothetical protein [Streptomonospora litoralis]QBI53436.1 hypothetical protein EKD16_08210 [Streptomonospora litoralis]